MQMLHEWIVFIQIFSLCFNYLK